jgi:hypothetical protein
VLANRGDMPAFDVTWTIEAVSHGVAPEVDEDVPVEVLPPMTPMGFQVYRYMGSANVLRCTVRWFDEPGAEGGERVVREQVSTVRF